MAIMFSPFPGLQDGRPDHVLRQHVPAGAEGGAEEPALQHVIAARALTS